MEREGNDAALTVLIMLDVYNTHTHTHIYIYIYKVIMGALYFYIIKHTR